MQDSDPTEKALVLAESQVIKGHEPQHRKAQRHLSLGVFFFKERDAIFASVVVGEGTGRAGPWDFTRRRFIHAFSVVCTCKYSSLSTTVLSARFVHYYSSCAACYLPQINHSGCRLGKNVPLGIQTFQKQLLQLRPGSAVLAQSAITAL